MYAPRSASLPTALTDLLAHAHPADLADVLERLRPSQRLILYRHLGAAQAAEVLHHLGTDAARRLLHILGPSEAGSLLNRLPMDDVAAILGNEQAKRRENFLAAMQPTEADQVRDLLRYPKQSAGRLATEQFAQARPEMTVAETLQQIRTAKPDVETLSNIYVLDTDERLVGVIALSALVCAEPTARLESIMAREVVSVRPETDREQVARLVARYDFLAIPVVLEDGRMLGIITVDDLIHVLVEEGTEDALRFGAVEPGTLNQPYFTTPIWQVIRTRIGWLVLLFVGQSLTGQVLRGFEAELASMVALTFYIPMLIGMGGNTGAQTVSTIIRGMALGEVRWGDLGRVLQRELVSGVILGVVAFGRVLLLGTDALAPVIALSIAVICLWANIVSSVIPLLAQKLKIDPALISAPLITTLVDATGLAIYLLIARWLLGL
jgi:magnesium transporter